MLRIQIALVLSTFVLSPLGAGPPPLEMKFVRGEVDANGSLEITDPLRVLGHLFLGDPEPPTCIDAADADDSGELDVSDPVYLLVFLFLGGKSPPEPWPRCGPDTTDDLLGCEKFDACPPGFCGGFAGFPCPPGEVCDLPHGLCDGADLAGTCVPLPETCPDVFDPVCGCDGVTYSNDCERLRAGAQEAYEGECAAPCGGRGMPPCEPGFYCEFPTGTCGAADEPGVCMEIGPGFCPAVFKPVCGCDGKTYSNDCFRIAAGVSKLHDGSCDEPVCGVVGGPPCGEATFCEFPDGSCGEGAAGSCQSIPGGCPDVFDPVCGCDDVTYSNDCERARAGVSLKRRGACVEGPPCGGIAGEKCPDETYYCEYEPGTCGEADQQGVCRKRPESCAKILDPVCGCDGVTYPNDCERARAGASLSHVGPCPEPPR